ncbi:hypothetical protein AB836_02015 [Rickettsiales bacterium (ex Bugula neritina AB1)]|nr:hypothetical protein AB836_02015 [Rickettsiales bacterium (ex Bugula neritina AB1)]
MSYYLLLCCFYSIGVLSNKTIPITNLPQKKEIKTIKNNNITFKKVMNEIFLYLMNTFIITCIFTVFWRKIIIFFFCNIPSLVMFFLLNFFGIIFCTTNILYKIEKYNFYEFNFNSLKSLFVLLMFFISFNISLLSLELNLIEIIFAFLSSSVFFIVMFLHGKYSNDSYESYWYHIKNIGGTITILSILLIILFITDIFSLLSFSSLFVNPLISSSLLLLISIFSCLLSSINISFLTKSVKDIFNNSDSNIKDNNYVNFLIFIGVWGFYMNFMSIFIEICNLILHFKK